MYKNSKSKFFEIYIIFELIKKITIFHFKLCKFMHFKYYHELIKILKQIKIKSYF